MIDLAAVRPSWRFFVDSQRFDSLVKSLAGGTNRRVVLKGLFGLGGAVALGSALHESSVEAARRPTPTPKPPSCPGQQHWNGSECECPDGTDKCGPDCCPAEAECCDAACCYGHCYGQELCCPGDNWCDAVGECCPEGTVCCGESGCQDVCCAPNACGGACGGCEEGQICQNGLCLWTCSQSSSSLCTDHCTQNWHCLLISLDEPGFCVALPYFFTCAQGCAPGTVCYGGYCVAPC